MKRRRPYVLRYESSEVALALPTGKALAVAPVAFGRAFMPTDARLEAEPGVEPPPSPGMVAVINITGVLYQRGWESIFGSVEGYDSIEAKLNDALAHPDVGAVVLMIDSPGGDTAGLYEAVKRMRAARDLAKKPIFAYADELVASAAYAIATIADGGIFLPPSAEVGCIGVLMIHGEASAANEKAGIKYTLIQSGARKSDGSEYEPLADAARLGMQQRCDELAATFFQLVADARGITPEAVRALEGACFTGQKVVDLRLANALATREEVLAMAAQAVTGATGMTDEEKAEMEALKAENAALKAAAAEGDDDAEEETSDGEEDASEDEDGEEDETAPAAQKGGAKAELARLKRKDEARDLVDEAARAGKVKPAARKDLVAHGVEHGIPSLKAVLALLPQQKPERRRVEGGPPPPPPGSGATALSPVEKTVAKAMGITEEAFAKSKASIQKEEV